MTYPENPGLPIDPATAVLYFDLHIDLDNMMEDGESYDLHVLENKALQELKKRLPLFRGTNEGHDQYDDLVCKISVQNWHEVREIWDWVSHNTGGGDDIVYLTTPYAEVRNFFLYPRGLDHPAFSSGGFNEGIEFWLEAYKPRPTIYKETVRRDPEWSILLCSWGEGVQLRRVKPVIDEIEFEIRGLGGHLDAVLSMGLLGEEPTNFQFKVSANKNILKRTVSRVSWFLKETLLGPYFESEQIYETLIEELCLPRRLPDNVIGLTVFEEEAIEAHEQVLGDKTSISHPLIGKVSSTLSSSASPLVSDDDGTYVLIEFKTLEGNTYNLAHGLLRRIDKHDMNYGIYEPSWSVYTDSVTRSSPKSWYVVDDNSCVVGAGRTPAEALRDVPFFVWPGEWESWKAKHFEPGELVEDLELFHMLGSWPPFYWKDKAFLEWATSRA